MKAKIFSLMALVLGMVSCQTEPEGLDVIVGGEVDTVITVNIPESETRANAGTNSAEGAFVNVVNSDDYTIRYIFAVYYGETCNRQVKYSDNQSVAFDVRLVPDRDYQFVVWADVVAQNGKVDGVYANEDGLHYDTSDLTAITLKDTWVAMDETRDAFTGTLLVNDFNGSQGITVNLTRPFAKLRVMTTDMAELAKLDLTPKKVEVNYHTKHYSTFDAFAGAPKGNKTVTKSHTIADVAAYGEAGTLFVDYFFATDAQEAVQFDITVYDQNGDADVNRIKYNNFNTDIPVKRNFLTTIKGNVLTDGNNIKVEVENGGEFGGEENWPDENEIAEQLAYVAMFGGEVTLTEDITLTQPLEIAEGANVVINLGDYTISGPGKDAEGNKVNSIVNNGKLTINGGTVESLAVNGGSAIYNYGTLELNGTTIIGASSDNTNNPASYALNTAGVGSKLVVNNTTIYGRGVIGATNGTKVEINGGTYHTPAVAAGHAIYANGEGTEVVVNGGTFSEGYDYNATNWGMYQILANNKAKVIVKGGDFSQPWDCSNGYDLSTASEGTIEIYGGTFADDPSKQNGKNYLAPGHYALQYETGKYTVQAIDAATRTLTINSKEDLLKLPILNEKWNEFFSNGQGTDITDFWTQNGGKGADFYYKWEWTIKLNVDIDFEAATLNTPIKIAGFGCFDGQNHTIKNVTIENDTDAGLFISSGYGALKNIKLDNVHAIGGYNGNSKVGILASNCSAGIDNINITNSSAVGGKYTGGVVGYGYTYVTNCTLTNCVVKGGYKCGGVIGYICAAKVTGHNVTGNTLTNCTVAAAPQHADNKTEYVLGMVVGNYNCNGNCADNVVYDMTTTATNIIGKIEGGNVVNESNNVVTYVVENYNELKTAIINGGNIEFANDITVDEWIMFSEDLNVATGDIITVKNINVSIDGKGHTLTVNSIESAGNNDQLFQGASVLNISNLTIKYADGLTTGGLGMHSGVIKNVHFIGGGSAASSAAIFPNNGVIKVEDCIFDTNGVAIYFEDERDNLTVTGCTFNQKDNKNVILLYGDVKFTDNIINSGRTVNIVSGSPVVTGNNFNNVRLKVYGAATATISNNIINVLEFNGTTYASTFTGNTLSTAAEAALNGATKVN